MVIDVMVTHPAYWRRGHATTLTNWFVQLAKQDGTGLGVAGAPMGKVFFGHAGFKEAKTVEFLGCEDHPNPIYAWLGLLDVEDGAGTGVEEL
jgi:GNAT superfamily N-acetyltransferase